MTLRVQPDGGDVNDPLEPVSELTRLLERRFRTSSSTVMLGDRAIEMLHPANAEDLLDEEAFNRDERLPYWADLWPSSIVLAERVAAMSGHGPGAERERRLLELGCGLGLVAVGATLAGFKVLATDYYDEALDFARVNAWRSTGALLQTRHLDWRAPPADLGPFDVVAAADVLYERRYAPLVASALAAYLSPVGVALIADPGRVAVGSFLDECEARGILARQSERVSYSGGATRQVITIYELGF